MKLRLANYAARIFFAGALLAISLLAVPAIARQNGAAASAPAATLSAAERSASARVSAVTIREITSTLAAPAMEGRGTATPGGNVAAKYLADRFAKIGLKPLGDSGSYLQPIKFKSYSIAPDASITAGGSSLNFGGDFVLAPPVTFDQVETAAPLAFVGYGVVSQNLKRDDLAGLDVKGKIAVVLEGRPKGASEAEWAAASSSQAVVSGLVSRGAVGIVLANFGTKEQPYSLVADYLSRRKVELADAPQPPFKIPPIILASDAGAEKLFAGSGETFAALKEKSESGEHASKAFDAPVTLSFHVTREEGAGSNVAGVLEGADPELKSEAVVYTSHYDAYGIGAGNHIFPGAADDALGVGTMISIAEAFSKTEPRPRRSIIFLAVTGEEYGLLGAEYWVHHPAWPLKKVAADINFDGIGTEIYGPVKNIIGFGAEHSDLGKTLDDITAASGLKTAPDPLPEERAFYRSDHYAFVKMGVPALMLMGAPGGPQDQYIARAKKWLITDYHQPSDTVRKDWNWDGPRTLGVVGFLVGLRVANASQMPAWLPSSEFNHERGASVPPRRR